MQPPTSDRAMLDAITQDIREAFGGKSWGNTEQVATYLDMQAASVRRMVWRSGLPAMKTAKGRTSHLRYSARLLARWVMERSQPIVMKAKR